MSIAAQTRELLLALAKSITDADSHHGLIKHDNLRALHSSLGNVARSILLAQNELALINMFPLEILIIISEFVAKPRTRKSMFELVKMTHICRYWRLTLISYPRLWTSIFVKNDHKDFVATCLERSRELPLTVDIDLKFGDYDHYPDCTCHRYQSLPGLMIDDDNPCRYHTTIYPLLYFVHTQRIRELDFRIDMLDAGTNGIHRGLKHALEDFQITTFTLPSLESLNFRVDHTLEEIDSNFRLPKRLFDWEISPPTKLHHLALHGCYGGSFWAAHNLTSFELTGAGDYNPIKLDQRTFLPFISGNQSLVSLTLSRCSFPDPEKLPRVAPVELPKLKTLRIMDAYQFSGLFSLIEVPALKTLSSLRISARARGCCGVDFQMSANNDSGFQLLHQSDEYELVSDWLSIARNTDNGPTLVRFEKQDLRRFEDWMMKPSPLSLLVNAKVVELDSPFASLPYPDFWKHVESAGPQLTTLRLEIAEKTTPVVATSVTRIVKARFEKGIPLKRLERMEFEGMSEEKEGEAKQLWAEFQAGLKIDQYLDNKCLSECSERVRG